MADKTYVVTAACAVVYNTDRTAAVTVARGGRVPADADPEHVAMLLDRGMIAETKDSALAGGLEVDPDAQPPFPGTDDGDTAEPRRGGRRAPAAD